MRNVIPDGQDNLLAIGRLGSPFGVQGFLRVHSYSGETGHFPALSTITLSRGDEWLNARVEEVRDAPGGICLRLSGCRSPEEAGRWTGWDILVPRLQASPLKSGEYYIADLVGCDLTWHGERIGSVLSILESGEASLLEIGLSAGRKVLVPFRKEFIGAVDTKNRNLELLVDWILE